MRGLRPINIHIEKIEIHIVRREPVEAPETAPDAFTATCPDCGWTRGYPSAGSRNKGLAAHFHHCPGPLAVDEVAKTVIAQEFNQWLSGKALPTFDGFGNPCDTDADATGAYTEVNGTTQRRRPSIEQESRAHLRHQRRR